MPAGVDGDDVSAVFDDPSALVKSAAYHQYPACGMDLSAGFNVTRGGCNNIRKTQFDYMGYSVRTPAWRYTLWVHWDNATLAPVWGGPSAEELYGHVDDTSSSFDRWENVNVAADNPKVVKSLRKQIVDFFDTDKRGGTRSGSAV